MLVMSKAGSRIAGPRIKVELTLVPQALSSPHPYSALSCLSFRGAGVKSMGMRISGNFVSSQGSNFPL